MVVRKFLDLDKELLWARLKRHAVQILSLVVGVVIWQILTVKGVQFILNFNNLPTPVQVGQQFYHLLGTKTFYIDIGTSLRRIGISFFLAVVIGMIAGIAMGRSQLARDIILPYIEILRPIPAVAWIPLSIIMWPTNEASIIYITFLGAVFPIAINTMEGVRQTPELLIRAAATLGAKRISILRHVILPSALPSISTGLAVGMGVSWFSLLAGEIISGQYGIGYFTWESYELIRYPDVVVGMLTIGVLGTLSTSLVKLTARLLLRWVPPEQR
ncbi:ABC transporter permease [Acidihalobacter yilgarnensis]|uniref:ABC transporter permease n=1 Tax=Acidihalobacter yilgarnensis TaxID=2819280 RepID=A0A1D8ITI6_9GAMM|nr:ABC transporter permease [Acidihalobacter yilgarnensis]